ncbi:MAG: hypothetical protein ISS35_08995 [Kiritimatiellae bacterium]|nr:hypothetical protein [Kiritimatiellia bacterium]
MSAVSETIAREYFEMLGYLVCQPRKYSVPGRQKKASEEVDLVVLNTAIRKQKLPGVMVWSTEDLASVARAVIAVRGWHTERFYASTFEQAPDILRFVEADSLKFAAQILGTDDMAKVLCLPRLPAGGELKDQTIALLKEKGIDGVISFRTMLGELVSRVETQKNYEKSDLLQIIRLMKNYDLLRDPQLELFGKQRRKRT